MIRAITRRFATLLATPLLFAGFTGAAPPPRMPQGATPSTAPRTAARPNVVVIVLDDVGFSDIGAFGSEIRTPNIDALAKAGIRYNHFESRAICSSTRAALLTGRNNQTVRMEDLASYLKAPDPTDNSASKGEMPQNVETLASALRSAGYTTSAFGKWHIAPAYDELPSQGKRSWPLQRGFDHYYGFISGWTDQYHPDLIRDNEHLPTPDREGYMLSPDLVDHAIAQWDADRAQKAGTPRFTYLAFGAGHSPIQVPVQYADSYKGQYDKGWDALRAQRFAREKAMGIVPKGTVLPPRNPGDKAWDSLDPQRKRVFARFMEVYAGFLTHTDEQIGRLVAHLKETGDYDNTLFVFLSDNGAASEGGQDGNFWNHYRDRDGTTIAQMEANLSLIGGPKTHSLYQRPWAMAGVTPFRRYKLWPYSGGVRTAMIMAWPDRIKAKGTIRSQPVDVIDLAPTIVGAAGAVFHPAIDGVAQIPVAGRSVADTWTSATAATRPVQFFSLRGNRAIRSGPWRAVSMHELGTDFSQDKWQLFNLDKDFAESVDLSKSNPAKLEEMKRLWESEAAKYSSPTLAKPVPMLYKMNGIGDAFIEQGK